MTKTPTAPPSSATTPPDAPLYPRERPAAADRPAGQLPGADRGTPLIVVSRSGATTTGPTVLSPEDLIAGWRR